MQVGNIASSNPFRSGAEVSGSNRQAEVAVKAGGIATTQGGELKLIQIFLAEIRQQRLPLCGSAALAAYCGAYAMWAEATEAIQKYGSMVKSPTDYPEQSPYVSIANRQAEIMTRIASEFGFTPEAESEYPLHR
jgi:P27 family predicted phage terminase small subunit